MIDENLLREALDAFGEYKKSKLLVILSQGSSLPSSAVEIESAFDHIYTSSTEANESVAKKELTKAISHIRRATIDNLRVATSEKIEFIEKLINLYGTPPKYREAAGVLVQLKDIHSKLLADQSVDIRSINNMMLSIINNIDFLETAEKDLFALLAQKSRNMIYAYFATFVSVVSLLISIYLYLVR